MDKFISRNLYGETAMKSEKALIVVDMQEDYIGESSRYNYYPNLLVDKVNERIVSADRVGVHRNKRQT